MVESEDPVENKNILSKKECNMNEHHDPLKSISWQLKRIADVLEEMNEINKSKDKTEEISPGPTGINLREILKSKSHN